MLCDYYTGLIAHLLLSTVGESSHLVEFPSCLLPQGCKPGSIVSIACQRNASAEQEAAAAFWDLQDNILETFGRGTPEAPELKLRNVTQTSVALEWNPLVLATSRLLSLTVWRNNQRVALVPNAHNQTSHKVSGLPIDQDFSFHLVMQTTAGVYTSNVVKTRTHKLEDTSGVKVCFGALQPPEWLDACHEWLQEMGAAATDGIQIDTTHFVCTGPGSSPASPTASHLYQRALQLSIPIVVPAWLQECASKKRLAAVKNFVLGGTETPQSSIPRHRTSASASVSRTSLPSQSQSQPPSATSPPQSSTSKVLPEEPAEASETDAQTSAALPSSASGQEDTARPAELKHVDTNQPTEHEARAASGVQLQTPVETPAGSQNAEEKGTEDRQTNEGNISTADDTGEMEEVKL